MSHPTIHPSIPVLSCRVLSVLFGFALLGFAEVCARSSRIVLHRLPIYIDYLVNHAY